jgi:hypothetical protein
MFYKEFHTDSRQEIRRFDSWQAAQDEAARMITQFKYWGGGSVPVTIAEYRRTAAGKYAEPKTEPITFDPALYMDYARENGNKYGYYKDMQRIQAARVAA